MMKDNCNFKQNFENRESEVFLSRDEYTKNKSEDTKKTLKESLKRYREIFIDEIDKIPANKLIQHESPTSIAWMFRTVPTWNMNQVITGCCIIELSIAVWYFFGSLANILTILLGLSVMFFSKEKTCSFDVNEFNTAEGREQVSTYSDKGGFGFINRGIIDSNHITGGVSKKNDILQNGMGKDVHFKYSDSLTEVSPEVILTEDFWNYHITEMKMHIIKQESIGEAKFDRSHVQQMYDPDFVKHMIENFRPLVEKVKGKNVILQPCFLTMGGKSPRALITFENLYMYLKNTYDVTLNLVAGMWGTMTEEYDENVNKNKLVGYEKRSYGKVYYQLAQADIPNYK